MATPDGSDDCPNTWADDDHLDTAYGDGWGFEPKVDKKLSLGCAGARDDYVYVYSNDHDSAYEAGDGMAMASAPKDKNRSGISYNAGRKRYLWCQIHPESTDPRGPRYQGGFGIYEAPEPWGPGERSSTPRPGTWAPAKAAACRGLAALGRNSK